MEDKNTAQSANEAGGIPSGINLNTIALLLFALGIIAALVLTVYYRAPMLKYYGFYEPDGYFHYSMIQAALRSNWQLPQDAPLSGWPPSCNNYNCTTAVPHHEPFGLYWVTLVPYAVLQYVGLSAYSVMRIMPLLFGILDVIGAYLLSRYWSKDKLFGVLVMLFVALNMGNAARTSATIYRGDSFITPFLLVALILTIELFRTENKNRKITYMIGVAIFLALCNLVWNGAPFVTAIYIFALVMMLLFGFTLDKKKMIDNCKYMLGALLIWYFVVNIFIALHWIVSVETFTGWHFFVLFIPIAAGWFIVDQVVNHEAKVPATDTMTGRFFASLGAITLVFILIALFFPSFVSDIFVTSGFLITSNFSATIQELQPPTYSFLTASFGWQNYLNPMNIVMIEAVQVSGYTGLVILFWVLAMLLITPYFFMRVEGDGKGFASGHPRFDFAFDETIIILLSFFAITSYLQMNAIRFNSLLSIPMSIFGAYTIYWGMIALKKLNIVRFVSLALLFAFALFALLATLENYGLWTTLINSSFGVTIAISVALGVVISFAVFYFIKSSEEKHDMGYYFSFVPVLILIFVMVYTDFQYIKGLAPADQINPSFISALAWMKNNTAPNSVVLTLWPDGSLVESVGNRTSITDSVSSQYAYKANPFAAWLYSSAPAPQFLAENISGLPDYLLVRNTWMVETGGIFTESGINITPTAFGYNPLTSVNEKINATSQVYSFYGSGLEEQTVLTNQSGGGRTISSYIVSNNSISPFAYVDFYNVNTGQWSIIKQTAFNQTNGDTFLIIFSNVQNPSLFVNITAAYLLTPGLANSNMLKFLFQCNSNACTWNNNMASLQLAFLNQDTKIFKIVYNQSNASVKAAMLKYPRRSS